MGFCFAILRLLLGEIHKIIEKSEPIKIKKICLNFVYIFRIEY